MNKFDIFIKHEDDINSSTFDNFINTISSDKLLLEVMKVPKSGPMAGVEWLLPTATIIIIAKPYFQSFMSEMGKDHYTLLKKGLNSLREKFFGKDISQRVLLTSSNAPNKTKNKYSFDFSIVIEAKNGKNFKLLIPKEVTQKEYENTINVFLDYIEQYYDNKINIDDDKFIFSKTALLAYNKKLGKLEFINPLPSRPKV